MVQKYGLQQNKSKRQLWRPIKENRVHIEKLGTQGRDTVGEWLLQPTDALSS